MVLIQKESFGAKLSWKDGSGEERDCLLTHTEIAKIAIISGLSDFLRALGYEVEHSEGWKYEDRTWSE